jgi:hypothetical protein
MLKIKEAKENDLAPGSLFIIKKTQAFDECNRLFFIFGPI